MVVGCLLVVALSAAATVVWVKGEIGTVAHDLSFNKAINVVAALARAGRLWRSADDHADRQRSADPHDDHARAAALQRDVAGADRSEQAVDLDDVDSARAIGDDQDAERPGHHAPQRALTYGGIPLLVSTIKQLTGLSINHVVMIDFNQFKNAVNDIGCVYSTVDRRYYHVNTPYSEQYHEINLQPGYQRMCGTQALQFVSYRHGDTSLVRDARDQDFLLDVKQQYGPSLADLGSIRQVRADLRPDGAGRPRAADRRRASRPARDPDLVAAACAFARSSSRSTCAGRRQPLPCDTATPQQISASVDSFLHGADHVPQASTAAEARAVRTARREPAAAGHEPRPPVSRRRAERPPAAVPARVPAGPGRRRQRGARQPPRLPDPRHEAVPLSRVRGRVLGRPARPVLRRAGNDLDGCADVRQPRPDCHVGGRTYYLYYSGEHLTTVAWFEHGAVYWIHNTLTDAVGNGELLAIAEQTQPIGTPGTSRSPIGASRRRRTESYGRRRADATRVDDEPDAVDTIGSIGGLLTLIAVPLLCIALLRRRRCCPAIRGQLYTTLTRESQLRSAAGRRRRVRR